MPLTGARIVLEQAVLRGAERLFRGQVTLVCLTEGGQSGAASGGCSPCSLTRVARQESLSHVRSRRSVLAFPFKSR